jgi:hypothetical protein
MACKQGKPDKEAIKKLSQTKREEEFDDTLSALGSDQHDQIDEIREAFSNGEYGDCACDDVCMFCDIEWLLNVIDRYRASYKRLLDKVKQ